jgi:hypothetical protein
MVSYSSRPIPEASGFFSKTPSPTSVLPSHATSERLVADGRWPSAAKQFFWDLLPKGAAPSNSGIVAPSFAIPDWLTDDISSNDDALEVARRRHEQAQDRAKVAEEKAHHLAQTSFALQALALALAGFQVSYLRDHTSGVFPSALLIPASLALLCFVVAGVDALEIGRVGMYWPVSVEDLRSGAPRRKLIEAELRGTHLADWTAGKKVNALLQARAWFSRGIVALLVASIIALGMVASEPEPKRAEKDGAPNRAGRVL